MSDNETNHIDTRNTKLNEKYQTKVYYRTVDDQYTLDQDCQSSKDLYHETVCPSCTNINEKFKKTGKKCEHGHYFYIAPEEKWCKYEITDRNRAIGCSCSFVYTKDFVDDTVCQHGSSFYKRQKRHGPPERKMFSTCEHGCSNFSNPERNSDYSSDDYKCPHGFPVKWIDYEKLSFNVNIYPEGIPKNNVQNYNRSIENNGTKVKGYNHYRAFCPDYFRIAIPAVRSKNPDESYDSFSDILNDETRVYRIHSDISDVSKHSTGTYVGNTNKWKTYQRHAYPKYKESKSENNAIIQTKNLIYTNNELIIEERFKPLDDRVGGRRGTASKKAIGKKVDRFEKGKYTHKRARV